MKSGRLYSREDIELISESAIGKTINDFLNGELVSVEEGNKGSLGQLVEKYIFDIETNSDSAPDFLNAGIELKVTPYKKIKNGQLSAKERLVLNTIDYMNEYRNKFNSSHFWNKNNTIQILWYLWEPNKDRKDLKITHKMLFELAKSPDLNQIEKDWNLIIDKIKKGKAHELSEADTMYLGACTKGANSKSVRKQPFSNILAMQRAFCFKTSYMTQLVRKYIKSYKEVEKVLKGDDLSFETFVENVIKAHKGKTKKELMKEFGIQSNAKSINSLLISRMFNVKGKLRNTDEFQKANIIPKTIRIEENGNVIESMSLPAFKYDDVLKTPFEDSDLKELFETTKYMFFVFKKNDNDYVFKGIKLWNMPESIIESDLRKMYEDTRKIIRSGDIVKYVSEDGKRHTNFPGMSSSDICHVRPHARNAADTYPLPVTDKVTGLNDYTKHCFWINDDYLEEILKEFND